ncbi:type VII toxin-antitoxin system MntA family adenylyltransferase antitoxin [Actinomycetospora sp. C-140]
MEIAEIASALDGHPATAGLDVLVLHGSRARGDAGPGSDWDFAHLADDGFDPVALLAVLTETLGTDAVDLVDLRRASALLRFRAARDGVLLLERRRDAFLEFRLDAVIFWCDAGPVIRAAQSDVLTSLG